MSTNVFLLQLLALRIFPVTIIVGSMYFFASFFPHLMYSFLIVAFAGNDLALVIQASSLDLILFMNLVDFSSVLLAFSSTLNSDFVRLPRGKNKGLSQSINGFQPT